MDINTTYMGLPLSSPIIVGSCGLTSSIENLEKLEKYGAGAAVLKSLFEEQINFEISKNCKQSGNVAWNDYQGAFDYITTYTRTENLEKYLSLIRKAKSAVKIPIIASINCVSFSEWLSFAKEIEKAGADALEINIFILPANVNTSYEDIERLYTDIVSSLKKIITIPVALKMGYYFTDMAKFMQRLSWTGVQSLVLFNRFSNPDINLETLEFTSSKRLSSAAEFPNTLRWTAILSSLLKCELSATTGVKTGHDVVKLLLAGAQSVQVASCLYQHGLEYIKTMNDELKEWMVEKSFNSISDFRGKKSLKTSEDPASILRVQFMKYYSEIE